MSPSWLRTTKKPSGCCSHHRAAIAADASPSPARTRSRIASRSLGAAGSGYCWPQTSQSSGDNDPGESAEHVLGVGDRPLLLLVLRRSQASVDVAADRPEHPPVAVGVAPAQIGFESVAGQVVREHTIGPRLHERQPTQPRERVVRILHPEHLAAAAPRWSRGRWRTPPGRGGGGRWGRPRRTVAAGCRPDPGSADRRQLRRRERPHRPTATVPAGGRAPARPADRDGPVPRHSACRYRRLSSGLRLRSETTRNSSRHAGSARQAGPGGSRPANTVTALAGSRGNSRVRTQSSSGASRS